MSLEHEPRACYKKKISSALGVSPQAVAKRAGKEGWRFEWIRGRGGRRKDFVIKTLPVDIRTALGAEAALEQAEKAREIGKGPIYKDANVMPSVAIAENNVIPVGSPMLTERQNQVALARVDLLRMYQAAKAEAKGKKQSVVEAGREWLAGYNTGLMHPGIFEALGKTSYPSVELWGRTYRTSDYDFESLAPDYGKRKGQRKVTEEEFNVCLSFALKPKLLISEAVRYAKKRLGNMGVDSPSSTSTLRRALEDYRTSHYDQWVFCREGEKALNDKCLPALERDKGVLDVGDVLVADGHTLNFQVLHPVSGKACRMTMVMWYDWASCMPVGWEIMPSENVQCIAAALRRAIITLGKIPKIAYLDNGKAFKAKVFTDVDIDFEELGFYGMFARLGIDTVFAWPYNAQSKPVERFFGTFAELERLMPTYSGTSIAET